VTVAAVRKSNPFAALKRRLPFKAFINREGPWRRVDAVEIEAACRRIVGEGECQSYAGSRGTENGCTVICFDTPEKAQRMQAWIAESKIEERPLPKKAPGMAQLRFGG